MNQLRNYLSFNFILKITVLLHIFKVVSGTTFTFTNKCDYTVWPGILANAGSPKLETTGFELPTGTTRSMLSPTGWSGRFWGRTGCNFDTSTPGYCQTGDCGSGTVECSGSGAEPPATLAEFTIGSGGGDDFYDVSLVDGYNLPVLVEVSGGSGQCATTGCIVDLNRVCPAELKSGGGDACKSACEAFGNPEYCCSGAYGTPDKCRPTVYSQMFKAACPRSYSYAYDDASSTFTCRGADYAITFCPSTPSQKSSRDTTTPVTTTPVTTPVTPTSPDFTGTNPAGSTSTPVSYGSNPMGSTSTTGSGADMTYGAATDGDISGTYTEPGSEYGTGTGSGTTTTAMLSDGSWLAGLAMGGAVTLGPTLTLALGCSILTSVILTIFSL
ncbi:hypothetical protein KSS87_011074 [Heliosperma pusillum]|nr:hypothetical protein KSS87_011074 [Heliosperma pusillum]